MAAPEGSTIDEVAAGDPKLRCPECGKQLPNPQGLGAHRAHAHGYVSPNRAKREAKRNEERDRIITGKHREEAKITEKPVNGPVPVDELVVDEQYQRPVDEVLVDVFSFAFAVSKFLPELGQEIERRRLADVIGGEETADKLVSAFFLLYNDVQQ